MQVGYMKFPKVNIIDKWLEENPNPEMEALVKQQIEDINTNREMIAVFCKNKQRFANFQLTPKDNFIRISTYRDLIGRHFTGVIMYADWSSNEEVLNAYRELHSRQPELF